MKEVSFKKLANFTPKQREARAALKKYKYLLFGGAKGGGKSHWLRWQLLELLLKWGLKGLTGVRACLFCEDYPTLKDRQVTKISKEFPSWLGKLKTNDIEGLHFAIDPKYGGGILALRNLDDPSKYASAEFAAMGVDELTKNVFDTFEQLRSILRWPGIEDVKFLAGTNPGEIGHAWVKQYFLDKEFPSEEQESDQFGFVQSMVTDNPYNSKTYLKQLSSIADPNLRKAYLEGDWNVFKGQFFSMWRANRNGSPYHVIPSYVPSNLDQIFGSMDWGFEPDSFAYHLHAVVKVSLPDASFERVITFAELYGNKQYPEDWAKDIKNLENGLNVVYRYGDPSAKNKAPLASARQSGGSSVFEEFKKSGINFLPGNNDRKNGYEAQRNWLREAPDGFPYWQCTEACRNLIKQIPAAVYDDNNSFLTKEGGEDHAREGVRYFLISRPFNRIKEVEKKVIPMMSTAYVRQMIAERNKPVGVGGYSIARK